MAAELRALNLLTRVDEDALAFYCVQFARWKKAETQVRLKGEIITTEAGNLIQNPYLSVANRALKEMGRIGAEFGFTPSSRTRLHTPPVDKESELEKSLFGNDVKVKNAT
jgi:P27 family predicted phage terminase small subunit